MATFKVHIDSRLLERELRSISGSLMGKVVRRALNRTKTTARSKMVRAIVGTKLLKLEGSRRERLRKRVFINERVKGQDPEHMQVQIRVSNYPIPVSWFYPRRTRVQTRIGKRWGVTVRAPSRGQVFFKNVFWAGQLKNDNKTIMRRKGTARKPIVQAKAWGLANVLESSGKMPTVRDEVMKQFEKNLVSGIKYYTRKG